MEQEGITMAINTYFLRYLVTTDHNMQASEETINRLIANYGSHIKIHGYTIESITVLYNTIKDSELADNDYLLKLKTLSEVILTYSFAEIELAAIMRANLKERNDNFYRRTILLQSFRIISESTKALFGFVNKDKKNAFWNKLTTLFDLSLFSQDIEEIKTGVDDLSKNVINKINRDIASHYDWDALAVESSYISIKDEDLICQNLSKYGYVIERVSKISNKLLGSFINSINLPKHPSGSAVDRVIPSDLVWLFEKSILKPQLIEVIKTSYPDNTRQLNQAIALCHRLQELTTLEEKFGIILKNNEVFLCYSKIMNSICLLLFMMNDALAAAVALVNSESFWESRMNLKRLDVSAYEALNKVVGFEENRMNECFFHEIDQLIYELPTSLKDQFIILKKDTDLLVKKYGFDKANQRNSFIHYRSGEKVWLLHSYNNLVAISIPNALYKIIDLRKLSTRIVQFTSLFSDSFGSLQEIKFKENVNQMFKPLRLVIDKSQNEETREKAKKMLDDFQNKILNMGVATKKQNIENNNRENII